VTTREGVVCPFCGLLCDDLAVEAGPARHPLRVAARGCPIAQEAFAAADPAGSPRIEGREASLTEACARAATILNDSRLPLIAGLATDLAGAKAAVALAERAGGVVDHLGSDAAFRNLLVMLDKGWITTTLAEVKNRVDLLILAGTDVVSRFPRFFERCVWNTDALFGPKPASREVVYIGDGLDTEAGTAPSGRAPTVIPCDRGRLAEVFGTMRALHHGRPVQAATVAGAPIEALGGLVERMKAARYGVVTWVAADLAGPHGELAVQAICDLVMDLNESGRFSGLPLGGTDNALGAGQVCTWQTGFPLRTSFAAGHPDFDPHLLSWRRLIDDGEADSLLWISAFRAADLPVETGIPTIAVVAPGTAFRREPEVYIPVGIPGLDHGGHIVRADSVTSLPLHRLRETDLPRTADALRAIEERMVQQRAGG
jgi:formylmethanofuran dehydrogenase subunit B